MKELQAEAPPVRRRRVPASPMRAAAEGGRRPLAQAWGKVRRFLIVHFTPGHVHRMLSHRRGACRRCGACCELLFRCPHLRGANACSIYSSRYLQCRLFPLDDRDVAEVTSGCGFWFEGGQ